ncbi:MAG: transketolase C-terminal domain-containing protein, partial [Longimicrobiales bacterium]
RYNTLAAVKRAGSGHLGSSFSAMDLVVWLYLEELNTAALGEHHPDRDVYFSSKGHDVPGLYAVLAAVGILPEDRLLSLRRLGGLDGHPEVHIPGIEANSGSLGMGMSKGRGMLWAKRRLGRKGRVFVLTGDGELQEGQNYEALHAAPHQRVNELVVIVDNNRLQTDKRVSDIMALGDLETVARAMGWHVHRFDGHDFRAIEAAFHEAASVTDRPKFLIADTVKGKGVSFMEPAAAAGDGSTIYRWHSGAPDDASFEAAANELRERIAEHCRALGLPGVAFSRPEPLPAGGNIGIKHYVAEIYGSTLLRLAEQHPELVVLDGDLAADCRVRAFEERFPDRFIENGIAEQDMVSMAGGLARQGMLPVVNSFASFLASRANEQIYNNATERAKVIYALHFAGLIPAGPGKSHQSVRDISLFGALPNCVILHPGTPEEMRLATEWCVEQAEMACALRIAIGPSPRDIALPDGYTFAEGRGAILAEGADAVLFAYGPVMLHEALVAAETLAEGGFGLRVIDLPWLNRFDRQWLATAIEGYDRLYVLDDHSPVGGLGDRLLRELVAAGLLGERRFENFAVDEYPACGTPGEVLRHHALDGVSLAGRILGVAPAIGAGGGLELAYTAEAPQ